MKTKVTEKSSRLITEVGGNRYNLNLIELKNQQGETGTKFGISRFWYCEKINRWLPSKKGHIYFPIDQFAAVKSALDRLAIGLQNGEYSNENACINNDGDNRDGNDDAGGDDGDCANEQADRHTGGSRVDDEHQLIAGLQSSAITSSAAAAPPPPPPPPTPAAAATTTTTSEAIVAAKRKRGRPCGRNRLTENNAPKHALRLKCGEHAGKGECEGEVGSEAAISCEDETVAKIGNFERDAGAESIV